MSEYRWFLSSIQIWNDFILGEGKQEDYDNNLSAPPPKVEKKYMESKEFVDSLDV